MLKAGTKTLVPRDFAFSSVAARSSNLVACCLSSIGIRHVTVCDKDEELAKSGADLNPAKCRTGLADLISWRGPLI